MINVKEQLKIIGKGADEIISISDLEKKLEKSIENNIPLTIKLGLDPSAPDIHLGHAVVLRKIKQLQDLGHKAVIIIGDFTGMIGDPTGKSKTRKALTKEQVLENAKTYTNQIIKILDPDKTEITFNSKWLGELNFFEVINLASKCTVARMMEREDFKNRFENNQSIGIHELFYPLMQGFDSVSIKSDVELGGTDQRFNILMGRNLQKDFKQEAQVALFMPLLEGIDGKEKMSKSLGNYIGISEEANIMFGKVMSIHDELIIKYFELATDIHPDEIEKIKENLSNGVNPRDIKLDLAEEIVKLYHDEGKAEKARENFINVFKNKELPEDIKERILNNDNNVDILKIMIDEKFCESKNEGKRLINSGAVKINGKRVNSLERITINNGDILKVGKRKFLKLIISK